MEDCIEATGLTFKAVISGETFRGCSLESGQAPQACLLSVFKGKACGKSMGGRTMSLEASIYPHFKGVVMPTKSSRPETWENLGGVKEDICTTVSLPTGEGRGPPCQRSWRIPPFPLTSMSLHSKKDGGLIPGSHAQSPSRVCTQKRTGGLRRHGWSCGK